MVWCIGCNLGKVMDVDVLEKGAQWGRCLLVRIKIDITKNLVRGKRLNLEITTIDGFSSNMRDYPISATSVASSAMEKRSATKLSRQGEVQVKVRTNMGHGSEVNWASELSTTQNTITATSSITLHRSLGTPKGRKEGRRTLT